MNGQFEHDNKSSQSPENPESFGQVLRKQIIEETFQREWLYVGLVDTDFKNREDEEQYIRAGGAVDALLELARRQELADEAEGSEAEGHERLRKHMQDRTEKGPARLEKIQEEMARIDAEIPLNGCREAHTERSRRGYYDLNYERLCIEGDLEIADLAFRYLDGEDICH